jgi:transcriptional regulator with XRE-family HTH domain
MDGVLYIPTQRRFSVVPFAQKQLKPTDILRALERRRQDLGMPMSVLAKRAGLGLRTVQRTLSGEAGDATLGTVTQLANVLGVTFKTQEDDGMRWRAADAKAKRLASMVQGTSALEDQAVDSRVLRKIANRIRDELLVGSGSKLWHE